MIVDQLKNYQVYSTLSPRLAKALQYLADTDFSEMETGTYPIVGKDIFAIVNDYETQPKEVEPFEVHQRYIDVQYVASGKEEFGYLPLANQKPSCAYDTEHDFAEFDFQTCKPDASFIQLHSGMFAIFFPGDIHMPGTYPTPQKVRKVVVKVKV